MRSPSSDARESISFGPAAQGVERAEVRLRSSAFEPHRHDNYAIGITTAGVQTFRYRGSRHICLPGQLHILHPDEPHDGAAATEAGFAYRILYVAPELVRDALAGRPLPFVDEPVHDLTPAARSIGHLLDNMNEPIDDLTRAEIAVAIADALCSLSGQPDRRGSTIDVHAVERVRAHLSAHPCDQASPETLEAIAGTDRFTIARHFRRAYGTSPDRYRTLRRLARARAGIESGQSIATAAAESGFADQSHLTRHFKRTYGMTPAAWRGLTSVGRQSPAC